MGGITKVALAGATGNLGPSVLDQLVKAGFEVTVLSRKTSSHSLPSGAAVAPVEYDSLDSLTRALEGQDAVVSTISSTALDTQLLLVEAAVKAGVKRFIPSEFGSDTLNEKAAKLPLFQGKIAIVDALKKAAASGRLSYTIVATGPFLDWGLNIGFIMNAKQKTINLYDGGDRPFSATTLESIGKATAGVLKHPEETKNRAVYVQNAALTLKQLAEKGRKATGPEGWKENVVSVQSELDEGYAELKKETPNPGIFAIKFIIASIWGEGYGSPFPKLDNEPLGVKELTDEEILALVEKSAK